MFHVHYSHRHGRDTKQRINLMKFVYRFMLSLFWLRHHKRESARAIQTQQCTCNVMNVRGRNYCKHIQHPSFFKEVWSHSTLTLHILYMCNYTKLIRSNIDLFQHFCFNPTLNLCIWIWLCAYYIPFPQRRHILRSSVIPALLLLLFLCFVCDNILHCLRF